LIYFLPQQSVGVITLKMINQTPTSAQLMADDSLRFWLGVFLLTLLFSLIPAGIDLDNSLSLRNMDTDTGSSLFESQMIYVGWSFLSSVTAFFFILACVKIFYVLRVCFLICHQQD